MLRFFILRNKYIYLFNQQYLRTVDCTYYIWIRILCVIGQNLFTNIHERWIEGAKPLHFIAISFH